MNNIEALAKAQKLDLRILQVSTKIRNLPEKKALEDAKELFNDIDSNLKEIQKEKQSVDAKVKRVEQDISAVNEKIEKEEKKLFSGTVTNPKELNALQHEIESFKKKNDGFETQELELLQELDSINEKLNNISERHAIILEDRNKKRQAYDETLTELEKELEALKVEARDVKSLIEPMLLFKYEELSEAKGGIGAAFYKEGTCSGCHIALPKEEAAKFLEKKDIGRCSNCKRILIPPEYADV